MSINSISLPERGVWENLLSRSSSYTFFQTYDWISLWIQHFGKNAEIWEITEGDRIIGLIPFLKEPEGYSLIPTSTVLNGQQVSDYGGLIIEKGREKEVVQNVKGESFKVKDKRITLDFLREDSTTFSALKELGADTQEQDVSPFIVLPQTFDEYLSSLDRHSRHELRRKMRRFEESGASFKLFDGDKALIDRFFELMVYDEEKKKFLTDPMKDFFREMTINLYKKGEATILFIKSEEKFVAGIILFYFNDEVLLYNSGFDPNYFHLSPGLMVVTEAIKDSIEKRKKVFDFLRGDERYKYDLGGIDRKLFRIRF